jgi:hypothetical protein
LTGWGFGGWGVGGSLNLLDAKNHARTGGPRGRADSSERAVRWGWRRAVQRHASAGCTSLQAAGGQAPPGDEHHPAPPKPTLYLLASWWQSRAEPCSSPAFGVLHEARVGVRHTAMRKGGPPRPRGRGTALPHPALKHPARLDVRPAPALAAAGQHKGVPAGVKPGEVHVRLRVGARGARRGEPRAIGNCSLAMPAAACRAAAQQRRRRRRRPMPPTASSVHGGGGGVCLTGGQGSLNPPGGR